MQTLHRCPRRLSCSLSTCSLTQVTSSHWISYHWTDDTSPILPFDWSPVSQTSSDTDYISSKHYIYLLLNNTFLVFFRLYTDKTLSPCDLDFILLIENTRHVWNLLWSRTSVKCGTTYLKKENAILFTLQLLFFFFRFEVILLHLIYYLL